MPAILWVGAARHRSTPDLPWRETVSVGLKRQHWNISTWVCSLVGHVAPGAWVARVREVDEPLVITRGDSQRLARCLRCDGWVYVPVPNPADVSADVLPGPRGLPKPKRGKALKEQVVTRLIALERGLHVIFFFGLFVILGIVAFGLPGIQDESRQLLVTAQDIVEQGRPGQHLLLSGLRELGELDAGRAAVLMLVTFAYGSLEAVEAVFLWRGKRWAEYLTVVATVALMPMTIYSLVDKVSTFKILALGIELLILAYLVFAKRLFGVRGGQRKLEADLAADVNWDEIYANPPVTGDRNLDRRYLATHN